MPAFQNIINFQPNPDSLKSGADTINNNFASAQNKGSGVLIIDPILPKAGLEYPTPPEFFLRNTTPSDIALARKVIMTLNGIKGDLSPIEQMRLEVFHQDSPFPDATQASLFLTVDALGPKEALRIYQHPTWYTSGLIQFVINPRDYLTDQSATLAVMSPLADVPAKLKISTPEAGGGAPDGINFEVYRTAITMAFGTTGSLNIPRQGNGSGNIFFLPRGAGLGDYLGVNTTAPLNTLSVYDTTSPSMSLQTLYWDANGPHSPAYDCRAIDGTLGAMGWEQLDYPDTHRKSRWFAKASTGVEDPDIKLELEEGNLFFTAPGVTREGLRNEERLSKVTYINVIEDFPGYPGDIVFTEGIWDANDLPFTLTQDIRIQRGAIVRNLNITTDQEILVEYASSTSSKIILESGRITHTTGAHTGLITSSSIGFFTSWTTFLVKDFEFASTVDSTIFKLGVDTDFSDLSVELDNVRFDGCSIGTFERLESLSVRDIQISQFKTGFFFYQIPNVFFTGKIDIVDGLPDDTPLFMTDYKSGTAIPGGEKALSAISGFNITGSSGTKIFWMTAHPTHADDLQSVITNCNLAGIPNPFLTNDDIWFLAGGVPSGEIRNGQVITGSDSGAYGKIIASETGSGLDLIVVKTSVSDFNPTENMTTATGSCSMFSVAASYAAFDQTDKQIIAKGNIGIQDSTAYIESSVTYGTPAITILPATAIRRINAAYAVKKSERFQGVTNGNLQYIGLDPIAGTISFDLYAIISSGAKTGIFYPARGNANNTIASVAFESIGISRVTTTQDHGYQALDTVIIEGTTSYNGSFQILGVPTSTTFLIATAYVTSETGSHYKVIDDSPYLMWLSGSAIEHGTFSRTVEDLVTDDILFLCGEVVTGDNLSIYSVAANFIKGS
jgi:hypothetical protein